MSCAISACQIQQIKMPDHIGLKIRFWIRDRVRDSGARRQVDHDIRPCLIKNSCNGVTLADIASVPDQAVAFSG